MAEGLDRPIICPHCGHQAIMEDAPGLAERKWPNRPDTHRPMVRCPICIASFPREGLKAFLKQ